MGLSRVREEKNYKKGDRVSACETQMGLLNDTYGSQAPTFHGGWVTAVLPSGVGGNKQ